jgi:hypothetical protein
MEPTHARDLAAVRDWWRNLAEQVPPTVCALWFGIVDLVREGRVSRELYVAGSHRFDPADETGDWAVGPVWWPEARYVSLMGFTGEDADGAYRRDLSYAASLVREIRPQEEVTHPIKGVAVGFDDGDFEIVWPEA